MTYILNDHYGDCRRRGETANVCNIHNWMDRPAKKKPGCSHRDSRHNIPEILIYSRKRAKGNLTYETQLIEEGIQHLIDDKNENKCNNFKPFKK